MKWNEGQRERERLSAMYGEMADGELLTLEATAADLTEVAQEALASEMKRRGVEAAAVQENWPADRSSGSTGSSGWTTLHVFAQSFEAQQHSSCWSGRRSSSRSRTGRWMRGGNCVQGRRSS